MKNTSRKFTTLFFAFLMVAANSPCWSEILFDEVSEQMGLGWPKTWVNGEAPYQVYNLGWPDFNKDGYPDLWVASHSYFGAPPQLWINQNGAGFKNIIKTKPSATDLHCGSWGDFDNDGDPDLYTAAGSASGTQAAPKKRVFYVNESLKLVDRATQYGLNPGRGSGRSAMWFDFNKDGRLDLAQFNETLNLNVDFPSRIFAWQNPLFIDATERLGIILNPDLISRYETAHFGVISDLYGDGVPDFLMLDGEVNNPGFITRIFRNQDALLQDITGEFPVFKGNDAAIADFNNDLVPDIFVVNGGSYSESTIFYPTDSGYLVARLFTTAKKMVGLSFKTTGTVTFQCPTCLQPIFFGSQKSSPTGLFFSLDATDPRVQGIAPVSNAGTYIGYDATTETWSFRLFSPTKSVTDRDIHITTSSNSFTDVNAINFTNRADPRTSAGARQPIYLEYNPGTGKYADRSQGAGFSKTVGYGVVHGDFDNDMDEDLYIRQSTLQANIPLQSVYYENLGDGTFRDAPDLKGASLLLRGPGAAMYDFSRVPTVVADYNADGFLDIYTSVGEYKMMNGRFYSGLPPRLFKNRGNGNHWLEIDLQGTLSNRDAIASKVLLYTSDGKVQLRMQDGGNHYCAQDQHRLHFGLGANTAIDKIEVKWPTGNVQTLNNIAVDQILKIVELPTNHAPVNSIPEPQITNDNKALIFSTENANPISIADADAGTAEVSATLAIPSDQGTLALDGSTQVNLTGNGTNLIQMTGAITAINAALQGLTFTPIVNFNGNVMLTITTNDLGHTGADPGLSGTSTSEEDADTLAISVKDVTPPNPPLARLDISADSGLSGDGITNHTTPTISGNAASPGDTINVAINGQTLTATVGSDGSWSVALADPLNDGNYTAAVTASDAAGNTSPATEVAFTVDTTPPVSPIAQLDSNSDSGDLGDGITNSTTPTISGNGANPGDTISVAIGGNQPITAIVASDGSWSVILPNPLSDGNYSAAVTANDAAGNNSPATEVVFTIDSTPPAAPAAQLDSSSDTGNLGDGITSDNTPTISGNGASADDTINVVAPTGEVMKTKVAGDGSWSVTPITPTPDGENQAFNVTAIDTAGNVSPVTTVSLTISSNPPSD